MYRPSAERIYTKVGTTDTFCRISFLLNFSGSTPDRIYPYLLKTFMISSELLALRPQCLDYRH